jgi:hypothetical protein
MPTNEPVDWTAWRLNAEQIVAELLGIPAAYIVFDCELPAGSVEGCWGATWPGMGSMLREEIGARWRGDAPAMVLNATAIAASLAGQFVEDLHGTIESMLLGVACHEVAHFLEWPTPNGGGLSAGLTKTDFLVDVTPRTRNRIPRASEHGPQFCWTCLHILHRLELRGIDVCLNSAIDYAVFNLPRPAFVMRSAVRREIVAMETLPLTLIARSPPPSHFVELFYEPVTIPQTIPATTSDKKADTMLTFFQRLEQTKSATDHAAVDDWKTLVAAVADQKQLDPAATLAVLERLGKTPADLRSAVATLQRRRTLAAQIEAETKSAKNRPDIESAIRKADAEFEAARHKHQQAVGPLYATHGHLTGASGRIANLQSELERTADPLLKQKLSENGESLSRSRRQRNDVEDRIADATRAVRDLGIKAEFAKRSGGNSLPEESDARGAHRELDALREEAARLDEDIVARQKFDDDHRPKLFQPDSI